MNIILMVCNESVISQTFGESVLYTSSDLGIDFFYLNRLSLQ